MNSAVLLLVFNRPGPTRKVLASVRDASPHRLYVAADGPRTGVEGEENRCAEVRKIFANEIDWPCELHTLFRDQNFGCRQAVSSAITWFFEQEEEGIILEDDCLATADFYRFCDLALKKWRHEERVLHVGGHVLLPGPGPEDVQISRLVPIWGWATWRRAWRLYDSEMTLLPRLRELPLRDWYRGQHGNVKRTIEKVHLKNMDAWGARWALTVTANEGFSVLSRQNLVSNIGFGTDSTHTDIITDGIDIPVGSFPDKPLLPSELISNPRYDEEYLAIINRLGPRIKRVLKRSIKAVSAAWR